MAAAFFAVSVTGCRFTAVKDEPVTLQDVANAVVVSAEGVERAAVDGAHLRKGDRVRTVRGGTAALVVRGRRVVLGAATEVGVPDGARVVLVGGSVLVDRRHGPGLTLRAGDTTVDNVGSGALRVEKSFSVVVSGLSAKARVRTATGPRLQLKTLYQVNVAGRSLPQDGQPLHLRDDAWERSVIGDLVADDVRLNQLAAGLDSEGNKPDELLPKAMAAAAAADEQKRNELAGRARDYRAQGGSWGVVARLVRTNALDVGSALSDLLRLGPPSPSPTTGPPATGGPGASPTPTPSFTGGPTPTHTPSPHPTSPGPSSPTPSPELTDRIMSLLPTPPIHVPGVV